MKCPNCQAKLMPVDGDMFCLQCGTAVRAPTGGPDEAVALEETTDPLLQRAITDAANREIAFRLPVAAAPAPEPVASFSSMRTILAPARVVPTPASAVALPGPVLRSAVAMPVATAPVAVAPAAAVPVAAPVVAPKARVADWRLGLPWQTWVVGVAVFGLFVGLNVGLDRYYANRVYPGVKVGSVAVGGLAFDDLASKLKEVAGPSDLTVTVGASTYNLEGTKLAAVDVGAMSRQVREVGRGQRLPVLGLVEAWLTKPVAVSYAVNESAVAAAVKDVAVAQSYQARQATPLVVAGQAFVVPERAGTMIDPDKAVRAVAGAVGHSTSVSLSAEKVEPLVAAAAYAGEIEQAQARMGLNVVVKVRRASYSPTPAQIGDWLVFGKPGAGVTVDGARVAAYVATIPGTFDRKGATTALIAAVGAGQAVSYTASTKKITATPTLASSQTLPVSTYRYCARGSEAGVLREMVAGSAWSLGGRLRFVAAEDNCDFGLVVADAAAQKEISAGCEGKRTCEVSGLLVLGAADWAKPPTAWAGGEDGYRSEVVNHVLGHWLGFDHAPCLDAAAEPVLQAPTLVLGGVLAQLVQCTGGVIVRPG